MSGMTVAIHQPNYLPYPGYFDKWDRADLFVLLDHVPYSRSGWQNRNVITTRHGPLRLSVPVAHRPRPCPIRDSLVTDLPPWRRKHRAAVEHAFAHAPYLDVCRPALDRMYDPALRTLGAVNTVGCRGLAEVIGIATPAICSSSLGTFTQAKTLLLIEICRRVGADSYLSGDGSVAYLDAEAFDRAGIELLWQQYAPPIYSPQHPQTSTAGQVSVLDLIVSTGPEALTVLRRSRRHTAADRASVTA